MLALLTRLADTPRIEALLAKIAARGGYDRQDNGAILGALAILPPDARAAAVGRLIRRTAPVSLSACGELLERALATLVGGRATDFVDAATGLLEVLPGDPAGPTVVDAWRLRPGVEAGFIVDLLTALGQIDEALAVRAADVILAWPQTYDLDAVVIPAIRELVVIGDGSAAVQRLRAICSTTCASASRNRWRHRRTGGGPAYFLAAAAIAPSSAIFSPIPSAAFGHSRPPKPCALTSGRRPFARAATSTSRPTSEAGPTAWSALRTKPAMIAGPASAIRT
jgi:hypothetical protein